MRTLLPLDDETIKKTAQKTRKVLVVTEANKTAGMSAEIFTRVAELVPEVEKVIRVAGKDVIIGCSPVLEKASIPSEEIFEAAMRLVAFRGF